MWMFFWTTLKTFLLRGELKENKEIKFYSVVRTSTFILLLLVSCVIKTAKSELYVFYKDYIKDTLGLRKTSIAIWYFRWSIQNVNKTLIALAIKETFLHFVIDCPFPMFKALTYSMSFVPKWDLYIEYLLEN